MKTMRKVSIFKVVALTFMTIGCLVSCNQNTQNGPTVNEMQTRLNDIMKEYQEMQSTCDDYSRQLAAKDSSIQAQAAEIQRLIDQLGTAGKSTAVKGGRTAAKASPAQQRKLRAELKAKKAEIARLQERLNQQTAELNALKAADNYADREALARLQMLVKDQENRIIALTNDKVALTNINDSLVAHVAYLMGQRMDSEKTSNAEYAAQVAVLQDQVANQQTEINRLREELAKQTAAAQEAAKKSNTAATQTKTDVAKTKGSINKKLAQLQAQCDEYYEELERLRAENIILKNENDSLRSQVVTMKKNVENVAVENAKMAAKMSRASVLSTSELNVTPLKRLSNGTGKPTSRASATHAFRIEGYLMGNSVVEPGTITLYAVITSPSNVVLHNGTVEQKFDANGVRTTYTMVQAYEFTGQTRPFDMSWSCDDQTELESGVYRLSLYANGNLIGVTEFKLK